MASALAESPPLREERKPSVNSSYGACAAAGEGPELPRGADMAEAASQWRECGAPHRLLLQACGKLMTLMIPVFLIQYESLMTKTYILFCGKVLRRTGSVPLYMLCEFTKVHTNAFPDVLAQFAVSIVAWRLLSSRAFFQLLSNHILVEFEELPPVTQPQVLIAIWFLVMAIIHTIFKVNFGIPDTTSIGRAYTPSMKHFLSPNITKEAIAHDPLALAEPENIAFDIYLFRFLREFVLPAVLSIGFLMASYTFKETLMPLSQYVEEDPARAGQALKETLHVHENMAESVVGRMPIHTESTSWEDICAGLRNDVLQAKAQEHAERDELTGRSRTDYLMKLALEDREACIDKEANDSAGGGDGPLQSIIARWYIRARKTVTMRWWSTKLLLKNNIKDKEAQEFRKYWKLYHLLAFLVMFVTCLISLNRSVYPNFQKATGLKKTKLMRDHQVYFVFWGKFMFASLIWLVNFAAAASSFLHLLD